MSLKNYLAAAALVVPACTNNDDSAYKHDDLLSIQSPPENAGIADDVLFSLEYRVLGKQPVEGRVTVRNQFGEHTFPLSGQYTFEAPFDDGNTHFLDHNYFSSLQPGKNDIEVYVKRGKEWDRDTVTVFKE